MRYRPEYDLKVIGENLRRLRLSRELSVEEVRKYLRLGSVQAIYKYESGKGYPPADTMFALMELYKADLYDITREREEDEKSSSVILRVICPATYISLDEALLRLSETVYYAPRFLNYALNDF